MLTRILIASALGVGVLLAGIAVVAAPAMLWAAAVCGAVAGELRLMWVRQHAPGDAAVKTRAGRRAGLVVGLGGAGGCLALTGLALLLGTATGPVLLGVLVVLCAVWWARRRAASSTTRSAVPPRAPVPWPVPAPTELSTPQLCLAWQHTYFLLLELPAGTSREPVAHLRERLLDEMERRDPDGFGRWLDAGARAGGNPAPYLGGDR